MEILVKKISIILFLFSMLACRKLVEVDPPVSRSTDDAVFNSDATSIAVITGIYERMISQSLSSSTQGFNLLNKFAALSSDELDLWSGASLTNKAYYQNNLSANQQSSYGHELWNSYYPLLAICNSAIEGMEKSVALTESVKNQLIGESKFVRALVYFYLVNLYGDVPIVTTTDYSINRTLHRSSKKEVYELIVSDLKVAQSLLSDEFLNGQLKKYPGVPERLRPTNWAATALLSRVYLFNNDYKNSEIESTKLINNTSLFSLTSLNDVFLKNNKEAIWQLQPVGKSNALFLNTREGLLFILTEAPAGLNSTHLTHLSSHLLKSFDSADNRKSVWIGKFTDASGTYYYPYKYKAGTGNSNISSVLEYSTVFRLAEQFLIRAEARVQQNDFTGAKSDLNTIRSRAGLGDTQANDKSSLMDAILHERKVELFTEWGHRWLDLKRTGAIDSVMKKVTPVKSNGAVWLTYQQWYPIPLSDIDRNPNLKNNEGY